MRLIVAIILLFNAALLFSQKKVDTVYLNNNFEKVRKSKATYFRCSLKDSITGHYRIMDYYKTGELLKMGIYKDKAALIPNGIVSIFYTNGKVKHEASYIDGKLTGMVKSYYDNGSAMRVEKYDNYNLISGKYFTANGKDTILSPYFKYPSYKGGLIELQKFLHDNTLFPNEASGRGLEGNVWVGVLVKKDGNIDKIGTLSSTNELFNKEAVRVIGLTKHRWLPGIDEGEPADIAISIQVFFTIK